MRHRITTLTLVLGFVVGACGSDGPSVSIGEAGVLEMRCGGGGALGCPEGYTCVGQELAVDGPGACRHVCQQGDSCGSGATCRAFYDGCTGSDCVYVCVPASCGGLGGTDCVNGTGTICSDDGTDACEPDTTADCPGACLPPGAA